MATKKRKQKQTLSEFKAWLDGVVELQDQNWHPNETQWKQIRDRISGIVETPAAPAAAPSAPRTNAPHAPGQQPRIPGIAPPPIVQGGIPSGNVMATPAAKQAAGTGNDDDVSDMNSPSVFI